MFYENDWRDITSHHNPLLYVTAKVRDVKLKRAMLDHGSSLNIISLPILDAMGVPRENITRQPIEVSGFGGNCTYTIGF